MHPRAPDGPAVGPQSGVRRSCRSGAALGAPLVVVALLGACSAGGDNAQIGMRHWGSADVAVELRPSPPRAGPNEVVVIVSAEHHRPVYDAMVFVRARTDQPWVQAIEDGHVGVYRRAVRFSSGDGALQVRLVRGNEEAVLDFPVVLQAAPR